ncbi:type II secretion system protein, partial [bacterium]|nr:type II secretion system protein [bacterium]
MKVESIKKKTLNQVQGDRGKCNSLAQRERVSEGQERRQFGLLRRFAPRNDGCKNCSSPEGDTSSSKRGTSFARLRAGSDSESQVRWGASHAAFTLTEVLLACVIVGVISALVLPIFVSKYRQKSFDLGFERMTKTLNNALDNLIVTENKGSYFST